MTEPKPHRKVRKYSVDAQGVINNARNHVDPERGIAMLVGSFNMPYSVAHAIYHCEVDVTCVDDQIISIQQK